MTKSNNWLRVFTAWVKAAGLDPSELDEGSVSRAAFQAAWQFSRMTWRDTRVVLEA